MALFTQTRLPNPEGKGGIEMLDLIINSLRMRPDRIIVGEIRRKAEAEVLFEAMHTGHSVYATLHADSISETVSRLVNPPIDVPKNMLESIDLCVVMFRDRRKGIRRVYQAGELLIEGEGSDARVNTNILYRWKPSTDRIVPHAGSLKLFEDLSRHTGLTQKEINSNLLVKKSILDWFVKNNLRQIDQVGSIMSRYYLNRELVVGAIKNNVSKEKMLKK